MPLRDIAEFFDLSDQRYLELALKPKSCGGGEEFKYFALIGDKFLDLVLVEKLGEKGTLDTGKITKKVASLVNAKSLGKVAREFKLPDLMKPLSPKHKIHDNELKEAIEALLGISYLLNGYSKGYKVAAKLIDLLKEFSQESNYKGMVNELLQKNGSPPSTYTAERVGGPDHEPIFQATAIADLENNRIEVKGMPKNSKKDAEHDAAKQLYREVSKLLQGNA